MRALLVDPGESNSARLDEIPEPDAGEGSVLVETLAVGICGTDIEILAGDYGWAPPGKKSLVLGHESLGRVVSAPAESSLKSGDLVVAIVRHPDPAPCRSCGAGEWDMCTNGEYTEHGIKQRDGFFRERFRADEDRLVKVSPELAKTGVLVETASVIAKAWEHIERIGHRAYWHPQRVLVTGAGPVGLMAALMATQRGFDVHVLDRAKEGLKPELVRSLGAHYHVGDLRGTGPAPDVVIECTGVGEIVMEAMQYVAASGIVCLTGIGSPGRKLTIEPSALNRMLVLDNEVVFGSVNANRRHYALAVEALAQAEPAWLERLITRRVPITRWQEALDRRPDDVKTVIEFGEGVRA